MRLRSWALALPLLMLPFAARAAEDVPADEPAPVVVTAPEPKAKPAPRPAKAPVASDKLSLFYPVAQKSVQILPQTFEYELLNKDQFRVGNILFDARLFEFKVGRGAREDKFKLKLKWPSGLLGSGEISIRDNIGKAIWISPMNPQEIKFSRKLVEGNRQETAQLDADILPEDIFQKLQYVPYFQVCVQKNEQLTRISLCSKDFFVQVTKGKLEIRSRDSLRQESFVNINGNNVDPNGVIFLQGTTNVISMRVLLLSGSTLDIDTRKKEVEYRDIAANPQRQTLQLNGIGAHPVTSHKVVDLEDGSWRTELNLERPVIYLRGEGDIPMKQEFIVNGKVRDTQTRIEVDGELPIATYASSVQIRLKKNPGMQVRAVDDTSNIDLNGKEPVLLWNLEKLSTSVKNRRMIALAARGETINAGWDITRHPRWDLNLQLGLPGSASLGLRGWFENQHLGMGFEYRYDTEWKKGTGAISRMALPVYYSFPEHRNFVNAAWGLMAAPVNYGFTGGSAAGLSVGAFGQWQPGFAWLGKWNLTELWFFHQSFGTDVKADGEVRLKSEFLYELAPGHHLGWGPEFNMLGLKKGEASESLTRPGLFFEYRFQF